MPIRNPNMAANAAPISMAIMISAIPGIFSSTSLAKTAEENAPTHINPAWPRLSSPEMPTTRFNDTASIM